MTTTCLSVYSNIDIIIIKSLFAETKDGNVNGYGKYEFKICNRLIVLNISF